MDHSATIFLMDSKGDFYGTSNFQESQEIRRSKLQQLIKNG
jgi:protein SCO1/2